MKEYNKLGNKRWFSWKVKPELLQQLQFRAEFNVRDVYGFRYADNLYSDKEKEHCNKI